MMTRPGAAVYTSPTTPTGTISGLVDGALAALSQGDTSAQVVFNAAFTSKPAVTAKLLSPTGATEIAAKIDYSTLTVVGVTVRFSAIPASGWWLSWDAILRT